MSLPRQNPRIPEGINASEDNPLIEFAWLAVTVLLAMAGFLLVLSIAVKWLAPYIPFSWEQGASAAVDHYLESEVELPPERLEARAALTDLSRALLASSLELPIGDRPAGEVVPVDAFRFHLVPGASPNAFATLGANVMVTEGLLRQVQSENGLAMVIAHEIAHVQLRHPIESMGRGLLLQLVLGVVLGTTDNSAVGGLLSSGSLLTLLSFSRDMELAADARALQILKLHYGHLGGADEFFRAMDSAGSEDDWLEFTSTHPDTDRRLALIDSAMREDGVVLALRNLPRRLSAIAAASGCAVGQSGANEESGASVGCVADDAEGLPVP